RAIVCLNARDRNVLGFHRDLLTMITYGLTDVLLVFGDRPSRGTRSGSLTVRQMLSEYREMLDGTSDWPAALRVGVTTRLIPLPSWKSQADFLFVQVSFSLDELIQWRRSITFDGPVYAGVLVPASLGMIERLQRVVTDLIVPKSWMSAIAEDQSAGVRLACDLLLAIRDCGMFDGVHLIPVSRYRDVATLLDGQV
ncbi:MAG: methylenetetrahydrofolate reductase, partial [Gammaproteobacteria bacterium]